MSAGTPAADAVLQRLQSWRERGWLGALDLALVRFAMQAQDGLPASLLLALGWLGRLASRGHVCLDLQAFAADRAGFLGWPPQAAQELLEAASALPTDAEAAAAAWRQAAPVLACVQAGQPVADAPWVLDGPRLYLRRLWLRERAVGVQLAARAAAAVPQAAAGALAPWLDTLFPPAARAAGATGPDWQREACARAFERQLTLVTGGPGTGKTYTAARLLVVLQALSAGPEDLRVALAAPTGKAAARLRQSVRAALDTLRGRPGVPARALERAAAAPSTTLHALLEARPGERRFGRDGRRTLPLDLLLVDEASMIDVELMAALLEALPPGARLVLLGDEDQLASVEAGSVMADLCAAPAASALAAQTVRLRESRRFGGAIGACARAVQAGPAEALATLRSIGGDGEVRLLPLPSGSGEPGRAARAVASAALAGDEGWPTHGHWLRELGHRPPEPGAFEAWARGLLLGLEAFRVLCAVREGDWGVAGINVAIERLAQQRGWIHRRGEWYEGRPVMVTRNDAASGVFNGDVGLVLRSPRAAAAQGTPALRAWFLDGDGLHSVAVGRLPPVETAYAMTVHKSQGSEFTHVLMALPPVAGEVLTRELLYTGITRARERLTIALPDPEVVREAAGRRTQRMSGLRQRLQ